MRFTSSLCRQARRCHVNVPMLRTCCGCCSVKLGTAVLGTAETVLASLHLLLVVASYISVDWDVLTADLSAYDMAFEVVLAIIAAVALCVNILLLIGVGKSRPRFVLPAVVFYLLMVSLYCGLLITFFILYVSSRRATVTGVDIIVFSLLLFFPSKIFMYFWLVVYSCYRQMKHQAP